MAVLFVSSSAASGATRPFVILTLGAVIACGVGAKLHYNIATTQRPRQQHAGGRGQPQVQIPTAVWYPCFEDKCKCREHFADCSQNYGKLTFIPKLPREIQSVNFSYNNLDAVHADFFANVTDISSIDQSHNELIEIHPDAFQLVSNLTCMALRDNSELTYRTLEPVFSVRTLQQLDVSGLNLGQIPADFFQRYTLQTLKSLNLFGNRLLSGNLTNFAKLENLVNLELGYNDISSVVIAVVVKFETMSLEHNSLHEFPESCKDNSSLFPSLTALVLRGNAISSVQANICLPKLSYLDLSQNFLSAILIGSFSISRFPKVEVLHLDSMVGGVVRLEDYAFNNHALKVLSLANNYLKINDNDAVKPYSFVGCYRLSKLVMAGNDFAETIDSKIQQLFGVLPPLRELDLSSGLITEISNLTFANLSALEQLSLSSNQLKSLPGGVVDLLENLTGLDVSNNRLSVVTEVTFNATTRHRLRHLDLSGNRFRCSCDLMWFRQWFVAQPSLFTNSKYQYTCCCDDDLNRIPIKTFYKDKQACVFTESIIVFAIVLNIVILTVVIIVSVAIARICDQPLLIRAFRARENGVRFAQNENFQYDVFVSYAEEDDGWVRDHLMPELEGRLGLRLCVHQRDFHPGRNILDNIEDCLESSKKAMMIFSTHFARSQWCQFELSLCQRHVMDNDDVLMTVCVEDVLPREWTSGMMAILRTSTYIQWSEDPQHRANFWNIVVNALNDVIAAARPAA